MVIGHYNSKPAKIILKIIPRLESFRYFTHIFELYSIGLPKQNLQMLIIAQVLLFLR